jgi:catechol 2,3-dioxygenase-like lactoylglutathione lyase family enzyme
MPKSLPPRPDLDWLKKAAKERLAELRGRDPDAKLHAAQLEIARDYGFASWRALKAHVDTVSLDGQIIAAAIHGDAGKLDGLLAEHPAKIRTTGGQWKLPLLHHAAANGHLDCVDLLLRRGFDVHTLDQFDHASALHWAAYGGHLQVVQHLIDAGADIGGSNDEHALGVLGWATCFETVHEAVADLLLARGAEPNIFAAIALDRPELVRALVNGRPFLIAQQMSKFEHNRSPLHFAVLKNRPRVVETLLQLGADVAARDITGNTALDEAGPKTDPAITQLLLAAGAKRRDRDEVYFESAIPILNVSSVPASISYYVDQLGFRLEWDWGDPPTFACVFRDKVRIFLCQGAQGAAGTWIAINVQNVDDLYEIYRNRGVTIRQKPTNFPWGMREMNVEDPDGHRLRMGSEATGPADGLPLPEIA